MSTDWKSIVGAVAPALATALGGPLAGVAVSALSTALLGKKDGTEDEVAAAVLSGGSDALLKLKQADQVFAIEMRKLDVDLERLHQSDRASARDANVKAGIQGRVFVLVLVIFCTVIGLEGYVLLKGLPVEVDGQIAGRILGTLDAVLLAALYYVFGSSVGSDNKTTLLARK